MAGACKAVHQRVRHLLHLAQNSVLYFLDEFRPGHECFAYLGRGARSPHGPLTTLAAAAARPGVALSSGKLDSPVLDGHGLSRPQDC